MLTFPYTIYSYLSTKFVISYASLSHLLFLVPSITDVLPFYSSDSMDKISLFFEFNIHLLKWKFVLHCLAMPKTLSLRLPGIYTSNNIICRPVFKISSSNMFGLEFLWYMWKHWKLRDRKIERTHVFGIAWVKGRIALYCKYL